MLALQVHHDSAPSLPPPHAHLIVVESSHPAHLGATFVLDRGLLRFGRSHWNELVLRHDDSLSRGHGCFERRADGQWWVVDNGTTNVVSVNDRVIDRTKDDRGRSAQMLRHGARVRVGRLVLEFRAAETTAG